MSLTVWHPNPCPKCGAKRGAPCRTLTTGRVTDTHLARMGAAMTTSGPQAHPGATQPPPVGNPTTDPTSGPQNGAERDRMAGVACLHWRYEDSCACGESGDEPGDYETHLADALIAAGFGDVRTLAAQVAAVERYAQSRAITAAARGGQRDRPWLDLLHIIERAGQDPT